MWVHVVLAFVSFFSLLRLLKPRESKEKSLDKSFKRVEQAPKQKIVFLDNLTILKEVLDGVIFRRESPNYEKSYQLAQKFGSATYFKMPGIGEAILNLTNLDLAKRFMTSSAWTNRFRESHYLYAGSFMKPMGLLFGNDEHWKESRKITFRILHQVDFFNQPKMEEWISYEAALIEKDLMERFECSGKDEITFSTHQMYQLSTLNILLNILMGKRLERDDPLAAGILESIYVANRHFNVTFSFLDLFPEFIVEILKNFPSLTPLGKMKQCADYLYEIIGEEVRKKRAAGTYKESPRDFLEYLIQEVERHKGQVYTPYTDEMILVVIRDLIIGGTDTTNSSMESALYYAAMYPEMQVKIQAEIDGFIGHARVPLYDDREHMMYTQAFMLESLRMGSPIPMVSRSPLVDSVVGDCDFPRGSFVGLNIYGIHRSEELWEDPLVFRPERFLSEDGKTIVNTTKIMPFGYGKRVCMGETMARTGLFIFFTSILQKFSLEISRHHPPPSEKNVFGLSRSPMPYFVTMKKRLV